MSDILSDDDRSALAAEYVLGTLDPDERTRASVLLDVDPQFRSIVRTWERRLGELHLMVEPVEPDPKIWERLKGRLPQLASPMPQAQYETSAAEDKIAATVEEIEKLLDARPAAPRAEPPAAETKPVAAAPAVEAPPAPPEPATPAAHVTPVETAAELAAAVLAPVTPGAPITVVETPAVEEGRTADAPKPEQASESKSAFESEAKPEEAKADEAKAEDAGAKEAKPEAEPKDAEPKDAEPTDASTSEAALKEAAALHAEPRADDIEAELLEPLPKPEETAPAAPKPPERVVREGEGMAAPVPMHGGARQAPPRHASTRRWRALATLMTLVALALAGLIAVWRYVPDRLPVPLRPSAILNIPAEPAPLPKKPAPPVVHFEE